MRAKEYVTCGVEHWENDLAHSTTLTRMIHHLTNHKCNWRKLELVPTQAILDTSNRDKNPEETKDIG